MLPNDEVQLQKKPVKITKMKTCKKLYSQLKFTVQIYIIIYFINKILLK